MTLGIWTMAAAKKKSVHAPDFKWVRDSPRVRGPAACVRRDPGAAAELTRVAPTRQNKLGRMLYPTKVRMLIPTDDEDDHAASALLPPMSTAECAPKEGWRRENSAAPCAVHRCAAPNLIDVTLTRVRRRRTRVHHARVAELCVRPNCALSRPDPSVPGAMGDDGEV
jgi:hypothetical protein